MPYFSFAVAVGVESSLSRLFFSSTTETALLVIALGAFTNERRSLFYPLLVREDLKQRELPGSGKWTQTHLEKTFSSR